MAAAVRALYSSGVDAVIDAALLGTAVIGAVRDGGQFLAVRPYQGPAEGDRAERHITVHLVLVGQHLHEGDRLAELADLASRGVMTLRIAGTLPAAQAAEAHRRLAAGGVRGRLVLTF
jgi:NADPH:quinone reductase